MSEEPALPDPFLRLRAADVSCPPPVFVRSGQSVAEAARLMTAAGATAVLVQAAAGQDGGLDASLVKVLGIVSERDVVGKVAAQGLCAENVAVDSIMSPQLVSVVQDELLIEAFAKMVRHNIRRLVVFNAAGQAVGVLGERDMLSARGESPLVLASGIDAADGVEALAQCFGRLHRLAGQSIAEGISSLAVGRLISQMHDRIMARAQDLTIAEMQTDGLGAEPAAHAILALGSQGRREQFLATDQDLALVHQARTQVEEDWYGELGRRCTEKLLAVGFPPCDSHIMLDNPAWRLNLEAWLDDLDRLAETPGSESIVRASLLADMRLVAGSGELAETLRTAMRKRLGESALLLKFMAREAVRFSPPLGYFGALTVPKSGDRRGRVDVKRGGIFPITQGAKTLALDHGLDQTGTTARLRGLHGMGALSTAVAEGLCEALEHLQTLRMRAQADSLLRGEVPGNDLLPDVMGAMERERLRVAFKLVAEFQGLLFEKYGLRLLG